MWKFVSRRLRDVYDKTSNALEVRRGWNCGGERLCSDNPSDDAAQPDSIARYCLLKYARPVQQVCNEQRKQYGTGSNSSEQEGFKRKDYQTPPLHPWLGAITWTSAIICGWYTSQFVCLYRRSQRYDQQQFHRCFLVKSLRHRSECEKLTSIHYAALSKYFVCNDERSEHDPTPAISDVKQGTIPSYAHLLDHFNDLVLPKRPANTIGEIIYERPTEDTSIGKSVQPTVEPAKATIDSAFGNLVNVIGEIEYQLGLRNLELGDHTVAVAHLKLASSHQHAGAAFNLGICYEQGYGVEQDLRMAIECYHLAATLGHPQAMYNLGVYYARGLGGLSKSRSQAKKFFTAAADLGLQEAIEALGPRYRARKDSLRADREPATREPIIDLDVFQLNQFHIDKVGILQHDVMEPQLVSVRS